MTKRIGSCTILLRMGVDFGDKILPWPGVDEYYRTSYMEKAENVSWAHIIPTIGDLLVQCTVGKARPGWALVSRDIVALIIPTESAMNIRWITLSSADWTDERQTLTNNVNVSAE